MEKLNFDFIKLRNDVRVKKGLRVSFWQEGANYLMPSEFVDVVDLGDNYEVTLKYIDPQNFMSEKLIGQKFLFGHPGKVVGYGILRSTT